MTDPKISVIMPVFNGEKYLREAIESILNQSFTDFEFIIVNDGSTDDTLEIIKNYKDIRMKIINNEKNIGLTKSLNNSIIIATGQYIARQDADDISLPNRFEEQVQYLDENPEVMLLGTSVYLIDEFGKIEERRMILTKPNLKSFLQGNQFNHGTTMFRRKTIDTLGGYNELFKYCQDYELWIRITKNYEVRNLRQTLYMLRCHHESIGFKSIEESTLYNLLAKRMVINDLNENLVSIIQKNGIRIFYDYLNYNERIFFFKAKANFYMRNRNVELARINYKKAFRLSPFDYKNNVQLLLSYLGEGVWSKLLRIYEFFSLTVSSLFD